MSLAAALLLFLTVTVGVMVLAFWVHPERRRADPRSHRLGAVHVAAALAAVAGWVVYLIGHSDRVGAPVTGALVATGMLGALTLWSTRVGDRRGTYADVPDPVPIAVLALHGAAAIAGVTLAVLAVVERS